MKKFIRPIYCGISGKPKKRGKGFDFIVDFENNSDKDAVQFIEPYFTQSRIGSNIFWFGYKFNGSLDKDYRNAFIDYIKEVQEEPPVTEENEFDPVEYSAESLSEADLYEMIVCSLEGIGLRKYSIDTLVYPVSATSKLPRLIAKCASRYLSQAEPLPYVEVIKADPANIEFDMAQFRRAYRMGQVNIPDELTEADIEEMIAKIHRSKTFSLRRDVNPVSLRKFISNFLEVRRADYNLGDADNVLIVDDFATTGTTLNEIIRVVRKYNPECSIYIFTLIGNGRAK